MSSEDTTVTAQCLCKANTFTTTYPSTSLPLPGSICHCTSCRRVSGGLHTASTQWTTPLSGIDTSKLKAFAFSERTDLLFCPTCSTPLFWAWSQEPSEKLEVLTGVLSNNNTDLVKFTRQIFVHDTEDGGASAWLQHPNVDGSEAQRYALYEDVEVPRQWPDASKLTGHDAKKEDTIPMHCKCKGVSLVLHRGDYSNVKSEDLPSRVDPTTHKYLAEVCACDSCRIQAGLDVFPWTFVDFKHIAFANSDKSFPKDKFELRDLVDAGEVAVGTLKYYHSSPPVHRFFCGTCSSTVFFTTDRRPTITDVAVGLLDASDGARAEGMLSWNLGGPLGYKEDGDGGWRQGLYERIAKCAEEDRIERGYPKNWERVKNDEEAAKGG